MTGTAPAGWYPDPEGSGQMRWWDGFAWGPLQDPTPAVSARPTIHQALRSDAMWTLYPDAPGPIVPVPGEHLRFPLGKLFAQPRSLVTLVLGVGVLIMMIVFGAPTHLVAVWVFFAPILAFMAGMTTPAFRAHTSAKQARTLQGLQIRGLGRAEDDAPTLGARIFPTAGPLAPYKSTTRASIRGRFWAAAPASTQIESLVITKGRVKDNDDPEFQGTLIAVALPPEVGARYPGLAVVRRETSAVRLTTTRETLVGRMLESLGWISMDTELSAGHSDLHVITVANQDKIAALELLDPAFMDQLSSGQLDAGPRDEIVAVVVTQGTLAVIYDSLTVGHDVDEHGYEDCPLRSYLESAMRIHKRVLAEYM